MRHLTSRRRLAATKHLEQDLRPLATEIAAAKAELVDQITTSAPLLERRAAHRRLRLAYENADRVLRAATSAARPNSYHDWSRLRSRLSALDTERQLHLMQERDDLAVLPLGTVQALDTGMSGPAIGDLQHGESVPPGTPPRYGLDLDATLRSPTPGPPRRVVARTATLTRPEPSPGSPPVPVQPNGAGTGGGPSTGARHDPQSRVREPIAPGSGEAGAEPPNRRQPVSHVTGECLS